jgi:uncharacterized protein (DUF433 family)
MQILKFQPGSIRMDARPVIGGQSLVAPTVNRTDDVCGGAARIRNTRYTVWGLVEWQQLGLEDAEILRRHPDLTQADLDAAWEHYRRNPAEIERAIRENEEA